MKKFLFNLFHKGTTQAASQQNTKLFCIRFALCLSLMMFMGVAMANAKSNILIAYFSWGGNTQTLAEVIQRQTGADIFRIEPATPYSTDYTTVAYTEAYDERENNARPAIKDTIQNLADYDYIFIGTPVWWMEDPMIIHTFMETPEYNGFAGKTIIPFCTYYSGASAALTDIVAGTPNANHLDGYGTRGASSYNTSAITEWLQRIGILDVVNGINNVQVTSRNESKAVYTIDGRLVNKSGNIEGLPKGLYVMDGKKFFVR